MLSSYNDDETSVRKFCDSIYPELRATSLSALVNMRKATEDDGRRAISDTSSIVQRRACELAPHLPGANYLSLLLKQDHLVTEAACFALGEVRDQQAVEELIAIASKHRDALCRESAVAALGALGNKVALPQLIKSLDDSAPIRRRAVLALSVFIDNDAAIAAIRSRSDDKDWQVRQIVENILIR